MASEEVNHMLGILRPQRFS